LVCLLVSLTLCINIKWFAKRKLKILVKISQICIYSTKIIKAVVFTICHTTPLNKMYQIFNSTGGKNCLYWLFKYVLCLCSIYGNSNHVSWGHRTEECSIEHSGQFWFKLAGWCQRRFFLILQTRITDTKLWQKLTWPFESGKLKKTSCFA
jgi:hypothetical protein